MSPEAASSQPSFGPAEPDAAVPPRPLRAGCFKELVFELGGGIPRVAHLAYVVSRPSMSVRVEMLQFHGDAVWEVARVLGSTADLNGLAELLAQDPAPPLGAVDHVRSDTRSLRWFIRWDRPREGQVPSLFHMVYDIAGPDALVMPRIEDGRIQIRVAGRSTEDLGRLFGAVERQYHGRFSVRLLRIGEIRGEPSPAVDDDMRLLQKALESGYYDEPKRIGVRELGEVLGWSKTVISRKLRALERRAVEQMTAQ